MSPEFEEEEFSSPESVKEEAVKLSWVVELLWAAIGLLLTIFSTFAEAFITNPPWEWGNKGITSHSLGITYQIGAVLLTGCLGGKNAGVISQVAYLILGLTWFPIFAQGGGWDYWQKPSFGYLVGFIPGVWLCGWLAFRRPNQIENLALSSLAGLGVIHGCGMLYLLLLTVLRLGNPPILAWQTLPSALLYYSIFALPSQIILVCLTAVLAFFIRKVLFY
ncbi:MAG: biotin transporter BioY [Merismopediaceae bacterium]|nr:biotin transporter BioY [Merismopediaceae bacterium]